MGLGDGGGKTTKRRIHYRGPEDQGAREAPVSVRKVRLCPPKGFTTEGTENHGRTRRLIPHGIRYSPGGQYTSLTGESGVWSASLSAPCRWKDQGNDTTKTQRHKGFPVNTTRYLCVFVPLWCISLIGHGAGTGAMSRACRQALNHSGSSREQEHHARTHGVSFRTARAAFLLRDLPWSSVPSVRIPPQAANTDGLSGQTPAKTRVNRATSPRHDTSQPHPDNDATGPGTGEPGDDPLADGTHPWEKPSFPVARGVTCLFRLTGFSRNPG